MIQCTPLDYVSEKVVYGATVLMCDVSELTVRIMASITQMIYNVSRYHLSVITVTYKCLINVVSIASFTTKVLSCLVPGQIDSSNKLNNK